MRLTTYINEGSRSREVTEKFALQYLEKYCQDSIKQDWRIYRGVGAKETWNITDPTRSTPRESPNASSNLYNLYFSNSPQWKEYPKRNMSIICSTVYNMAENFGDVFFLFPRDNAKIGVCPKEDIWVSFDDANKVDSLEEFSWQFNGLFDVAGVKHPNSWSEIIKAFKEIDDDKDMIQQILEQREPPYKYTYEFFVDIIPYFRYDSTLMKAVENTLDPGNNNFKLIKIGDPKSNNFSKGTYGNELWTDAISVMVPVNRRFIEVFNDKFGKILDDNI